MIYLWKGRGPYLINYLRRMSKYNYLSKKDIYILIIVFFVLLMLLFYFYKGIPEFPSQNLRSILINDLSDFDSITLYFSPNITYIWINNITNSDKGNIDFAGMNILQISIGNRNVTNCTNETNLGGWVECNLGNFTDSSIILQLDVPLSGIFDISSQSSDVHQWFTRVDLGKKYGCLQPCFIDKSIPEEKGLDFFYFPNYNLFQINPKVYSGKDGPMRIRFQLNTFYKKNKELRDFIYALIISLLFLIVNLMIKLKERDRTVKYKELIIAILLILGAAFFIVYLL